MLRRSLCSLQRLQCAQPCARPSSESSRCLGSCQTRVSACAVRACMQVWDLRRLERDVAFHSQLTYAAQVRGVAHTPCSGAATLARWCSRPSLRARGPPVRACTPGECVRARRETRAKVHVRGNTYEGTRHCARPRL